jgi:glycosyltransferase involved in cell wall biosynthesis
VEVGLEIERLGSPVQLHVVGCEPEGPLPAFVTRHGFLRKDVPAEGAKLAELFRKSDFFVMPTRAEALGMVYAESAAYGLPVMASDTGGVRDVARGEWSFVPAPGTSPREYADWAVGNYRDRAAYERLSRLARECYETELNWRSFCEHLVSVVDGIKTGREEEAILSSKVSKNAATAPLLVT